MTEVIIGDSYWDNTTLTPPDTSNRNGSSPMAKASRQPSCKAREISLVSIKNGPMAGVMPPPTSLPLTQVAPWR